MTDFNDLCRGFQRFKSGHWSQERDRWAELAVGQSPRVMVIGCSDSRVDPTRIFDAAPGEMFVVRNVANLVPPFETDPGHHGVSAALEYAVTILEVPEIVVIGHGGCGGVQASLQRAGGGGFIGGWIDLLSEARDRVEAAHEHGRTRALELEAVRVSLANLRTFPFVAEREARGALTLHGAFFAIAEGDLLIRDPATDQFAPVPH